MDVTKITPWLKSVICVFVAACGLFPSWHPLQSPACAATFKCDLCRWITDEEAKQITGSSTEEEIISVVENVCSILPLFLRDACNDFITKFGPQNIDILLRGEDPGSVCRRLGICPD